MRSNNKNFKIYQSKANKLNKLTNIYKHPCSFIGSKNIIVHINANLKKYHLIF